ncbi:hypothetical protein, partial [Flavobacterium sp.]|uniref:hypothetical protein n=1 Tax=Flavobacterium sp. TaxID=239 RepID=UPI003751F055
RIESRRLKNWDYRNNGAYFITICTKNRKHFFGRIVNKEMVLNEIGLLANNFWAEIPKHFLNVELGNFQIMPNHMHGILIINNLVVDALHCEVSDVNALHGNVSDVNALHRNVSDVNALHSNVSNVNALHGNVSDVNALHRNVSENNNDIHHLDINQIDTLQCNASTSGFLSKISPKSGSISTIIRSYKSVVSKNSRFINSNFGWQSKFHDHIIRNSESFEKIQNYIENNPINCKEDTFYN